jgi:hypothetical protein
MVEEKVDWKGPFAVARDAWSGSELESRALALSRLDADERV